jgi:cytohesin
MLLAHGADIAAVENNYERMSPLHEAALGGYKEIVDLLLAKGANINQADGRKNTPLDRALSKERTEVADLLRSKGGVSNPDASAGTGGRVAGPNKKARMKNLKAAVTNNTLMAAVITNNVQEVRKALEENPSLADTKIVGRSLLHLACSAGRTEVAAELIARGANVRSVSDLDGMTPLHEAAKKGSKELVEMLLAKGADANAKNKKGKTALDLATENKREEAAGVLRAHMGIQK